MKARKKDVKQCLIYDDTASVMSEAFQRIQVNLDFASVDEKYKVISCTSASTNEGKTTVLVNLANVYALKGFKVLIVDLDLRAPVVHRYFGIPNEKGIVDYLVDKASKEEIVKKGVRENLDVITRGTRTPFPTKVLESQRLDDFLKEVRDEYEYMFVDCTPVLLFPDPIIISKFVDAFVLVASVRISKKNEIKDAMKMIRSNGLNVVGSVINKVPVKKRDRYYYYQNGYGK